VGDVSGDLTFTYNAFTTAAWGMWVPLNYQSWRSITRILLTGVNNTGGTRSIQGSIGVEHLEEVDGLE